MKSIYGWLKSPHYVLRAGEGTLLQVLSPSNWCESSKMLFQLVWGGGTLSQVYSTSSWWESYLQKISWQQLFEGGGNMPRLFLFFWEGGVNELHLY